ncbi:hypothetical protein N7466_006596 [Penicillium verhagenii]|uniref:uncharacterized protein n=1 Tax=Penicillium verhagenii TaxID=1562060 RepID=UPI0025454390|nr:uncharacterized protein N7466_006596 [Penicillium verhagenii]KAJ5931103.1 hypothetical protein N7466_006596 [Penicillium verhagenii]
MAYKSNLPIGYRWRSSNWFIISCIAIALFSENFLYSYIVPILQVMLEERLGIDESELQETTSLVLTVHALVCLVAGPLTGWLADKAPNRRLPLLLSLGAELVGTVIIMLSPNLPVLLFGRALQAIGGNTVWIVGLATVADTVGHENTGKVLGGISSFFVSGLLFGPMAAGTFLQVLGYWMTWMLPILMLVLDMLMRMIMIENKNGHRSPTKEYLSDDTAPIENGVRGEISVDDLIHEDSALVDIQSPNPNAYYDYDDDPHPPRRDVPPHKAPTTNVEKSSFTSNIYTMILSDSRAAGGLICNFTQAVILVALDTTLPLHCIEQFGWNTARVSLMFLLLQIPSLLLGSVTGLLKDKVGTKLPTSIGFLTASVFLWLLGTASSDGLSIVGTGKKGQAIYMVAVIGIGISRTFISGCGTIEITNVMREIHEEHPERFGSQKNFSSGFSMTNFCWTAGMLVGPVLSGFLTRSVGYYYMNLTCAIMSVIVGLVGMTFLPSKKKQPIAL